MQGYWIELFKPRAACDVVKFLPENVQFVKNCSDSELAAMLDAARKGEGRVLLECPREYAGLEFGNEIFADSFKARTVVADQWFGADLPVCRILTGAGELSETIVALLCTELMR